MTTGDSSTGKQKKNEEIIRKLHSGKQEVILETLQELRYNGNRDILPEVIDLISSDVSEETADACAGLLNDLKDKSSAGVIAEAIRKDRKRMNLHRIVAACWQNGLDYSSDIDLFIDLVLEEDYMTALEAFTVVEENIHNLSISERDKKALYIESRFTAMDDEKNKLVRELLSVVKMFQGPFRPELN